MCDVQCELSEQQLCFMLQLLLKFHAHHSGFEMDIFPGFGLSGD